jgi:hypothetical protein
MHVERVTNACRTWEEVTCGEQKEAGAVQTLASSRCNNYQCESSISCPQANCQLGSSHWAGQSTGYRSLDALTLIRRRGSGDGVLRIHSSSTPYIRRMEYGVLSTE